MSAAAPFLRRLQQMFRDVGINDDVQIASHVGFLLLVRDQWEQLYSKHGYELTSELANLYRSLQQKHPGFRSIPNHLACVRAVRIHFDT